MSLFQKLLISLSKEIQIQKHAIFPGTFNVIITREKSKDILYMCL